MNYLTVSFTLTLTEKTFDVFFLVLLIPIQKKKHGPSGCVISTSNINALILTLEVASIYYIIRRLLSAQQGVIFSSK